MILLMGVWILSSLLLRLAISVPTKPVDMRRFWHTRVPGDPRLEP